MRFGLYGVMLLGTVVSLSACSTVSTQGERGTQEAREIAEAPTGSNILRKDRNSLNVRQVSKDKMQDMASQGPFTALPEVRK